MRYLVTGGAGFIGSHLVERLLKDGHNVTVLDDLSTGSIHNIEHLNTHPKFRCTVDTVLNRPRLDQLVVDSDAVFHLAAAVGVKLIVENPVRTIETNVRGTEAVLECSNTRRKRVLLASTSEVYGKAEKIPFCEDDDMVLGPTVKARWSYACSKAIDEFLALAYWKETKLPVVIARLFNTVGPRQTGRYGMVIPRFVEQALRGQPITVYADGNQSRTFSHVADVVHALAQLIEHTGAVGQVFNVGGEEEVTIRALAEIIKEETSSASEIQYVPYEEAYEEGFEDMSRRVPDLRKIRRIIDFPRTRGIQEIVRDVVDYFRGCGGV